MISLATLGTAGGLLSLFLMNHFVVDWIFQSHDEAMVKHNNPKVRAKHCLIYTLGFIPLLFLMHMSWPLIAISLNILFWSHFVEDTYIPVFLWAKYIRRPPQMVDKGLEKIHDEAEKSLFIHYKYMDPWKDGEFQKTKNLAATSALAMKVLAKDGFVQFIDTTLGKILMIAVDQIIHALFLIPVVILAFL